jgi:O-antigen ligase
MWQLQTGRLIGFVLFGAGIVAAGLVVALYYGMAEKNTSIIGDSGQYLGKFQTLANGKMPINVTHRLGDWKLYRDGISESNRTMLLGHVEPPPREVKTSAHNWYLDFVYNFGLVPLVPLLALMVFTAWLFFRSRKALSGQTWWLAALVVFIVLVDSNFKVTLRQPYPGIFAFFIWGLLLTRLRSPSALQRGN